MLSEELNILVSLPSILINTNDQQVLETQKA